MRYAVPLILALLAGCQRDQASHIACNDAPEFRFSGTVASIVPVENFAGTMTPGHFDIRYVLAISATEETIRALGANNTEAICIGIHSPSLLFCEPNQQAIIGSTYRLSYSREQHQLSCGGKIP